MNNKKYYNLNHINNHPVIIHIKNSNSTKLQAVIISGIVMDTSSSIQRT